VTTTNVGLQVSLRDENNLKLCVYYLKHMERVQCVPTEAYITLEVVRGYREQQRYEEKFNKNVFDPDINDKYWPRTMESIREYVAAQYGAKGSTLDYVIRQEFEMKYHATDPSENYDTIDWEMTARAPNTGRTLQDDKRKFWDILSNMCAKYPCWAYIKPARKEKNGRLEGWLMSCFLTTILVLTMLGTWLTLPRLSCPALCTMARRKGSRGKLMCESTLSNIPS
jgi:hypothetical protein